MNTIYQNVISFDDLLDLAIYELKKKECPNEHIAAMVNNAKPALSRLVGFDDSRCQRAQGFFKKRLEEEFGVSWLSTPIASYEDYYIEQQMQHWETA